MIKKKKKKKKKNKNKNKNNICKYITLSMKNKINKI